MPIPACILRGRVSLPWRLRSPYAMNARASRRSTVGRAVIGRRQRFELSEVHRRRYRFERRRRLAEVEAIGEIVAARVRLQQRAEAERLLREVEYAAELVL